MHHLNEYIGARIRGCRRLRGMTLQQLADAIHKSRATVSKYENGDITLDVVTLYEISEALDVGLSQLVDYHPQREVPERPPAPDHGRESPFFQAERLYFYFYDGRYDRLKTGVIDIHKSIVHEDGSYEASMFLRATTPSGRSSEVHYTGNVLYSDMLIRFNFLNQYNKLEQDLLYIFNPLELRDFTEGLLCGISSADLMPCAFRCLVALSPNEDYQQLRDQLMIKPEELRRWQKLNMLIVDNNS